MLVVRIEKEVEDDHKVALGCSLKQLICLVGIVAVCGIFYLASHSLVLSFFCAAPVAVGLAYFGWYTRNGMQPEDILPRPKGKSGNAGEKHDPAGQRRTMDHRKKDAGKHGA